VAPSELASVLSHRLRLRRAATRFALRVAPVAELCVDPRPGRWGRGRLLPHRVAQSSGWVENWQLGSWGEQATAKALGDLEHEGWTVLHDLPAGRGNVDHIVIGPGGVFLLDSKRLSGSVLVRDGVVTVSRPDDPDLTYQHTGAVHLLHLARQTHDRILAATRINTWVAPVMVLWADFPQGEAEDRCAYVHGDRIAEWLRSKPQTIAPQRVRQVADAVRAAWVRDAL